MIIYDHRDNYTALVERSQTHQEKSSARSTIIGVDDKPVTVIIRLENTWAQGIITRPRVSSVVGDCSCFLSFEVHVKRLDEIDPLLAEIEKELATLYARRDELLTQITKLRQEKASRLGVNEPQFPSANLHPVTDQSSQEAKIG